MSEQVQLSNRFGAQNADSTFASFYNLGQTFLKEIQHFIDGSQIIRIRNRDDPPLESEYNPHIMFARKWVMAEDVLLSIQDPIPGYENHAVVLCHGYAEFIERYAHVIKMMNEAGLNVAGIDLEGHGRSEGVSGHIRDMSEHIRNFIQFLENLKQGTLYGIKITSFDIFGHSLGGSIIA